MRGSPRGWARFLISNERFQSRKSSRKPVPAAAPQVDTRRRLRELLSVPERDRTDEQWDEIIELEIQLAPGNRVSGNEQHGGGGNQGRNPMSHGKPVAVVVAAVQATEEASAAHQQQSPAAPEQAAVRWRQSSLIFVSVCPEAA
jgi:hypothetical protein